MALVLADRVQETTSSSGTSTLVLTGAVSGFRPFSAVGDGNTTYYTIVSNTDWEVGIGKYTSAGTTLSRDTVLSSSASGAKISVSPGATVFCDYPASKAVYLNAAGTPSILLDATVYTASSLSLTNGVYVSGSVTDTQVLNDGNAYQITDGTVTGPAWIITCTFTGVTSFNRVVSNIDYTAASGHTIYFQLYNNNTTTWDNIGSYSGATGYSQYALEVLGYASYISSGTVQARLYHSNTGNAAHTTKLDYFALEQSTQGAQGPKGTTGSTGATGQGVATGGTAGQVLVKNSATNYDTSWTDATLNKGQAYTSSAGWNLQ